MRSRIAILLVLATPLVLSACASTPSPWTCAAIGAGLGGGGGAAYGADNDRHHDGDSIAGYGALGVVVGGAAGYALCYALQDREPEPAPPPPAPAPAPAPAPPPPPPPGPDPCRERVSFEGVHFDFDKSEIRPTGRSILDGVASRLDECRDVRLQIAGHTDAIGTDAYNQGLSERRAQAVHGYLVSRGLDSGRFDTIGYGESRPVADNASSEGRAQNRRVELTPLP